MNTRLLLLLALFFGLSACTSETPEHEAADTPEVTETPSGPPFLALHLYNPASDEAHQQFLGLLSELNEAIASTGQSNTQYQVWKVTGEQTGDYTYLFGSIWADRTTYDAVHDHDAYKAVMARFENSGLEPFQEEVYNRYTLLNPASGEAPRLAGDGATYLSMHLLNLDSMQEEEALLAIMEDGNAAFASAGHPETRYGLWKIAGDQTGDYAYMFGSLYADRAVFDALHEHPNYKAVAERHGSAYEALVTDEINDLYERVMVE